MLDDRIFYQSHEIIDGKKFLIKSETPLHCVIKISLAVRIYNQLKNEKLGYIFFSKFKVQFPDENLIKPDLIILKKENPAKINWYGKIHGVPDMVVEVLSRSTKKKDLTVKKEIYEKNGVKEYWIIDPRYKSVDVYILRDGKFEFDGEYFKYDADELDTLTEEEKAAEKTEIKVGIFDNLIINVEDIFSWGCES